MWSCRSRGGLPRDAERGDLPVSALRFYGLTNQAPPEVWLAIGPKDRAPRPEGVSLRIVRVSGEARDAGVEAHACGEVSASLATFPALAYPTG